MNLAFSVVALTIATLTFALAAHRVIGLVSQLVYARYVAVGGLVAFSVRDGDAPGEYRVRFEVGGPGIFHNVGFRVHGLPDAPEPPPWRNTMTACDDPVDWNITLPTDSAGDAWVMVTWVRPYLQGVESEAVVQRLGRQQMYEWRWYSDTTRFIRTTVRFLARRLAPGSGRKLAELPLYGRWRKTTSTDPTDLVGPAEWPPPTH